MTDAVNNAIPFGRYVGQDVVIIVDYDRRYVMWLFSQPWFEANHPTLFSAARRRLATRLAEEVHEERRQAEFATRRAVDRENNRFRVLSVAELCARDYCDLV